MTDIPVGYKQTEVGIIPNDWEVNSLSNISGIFDGTHQTPQYTSFGVKFASVENIKSPFNTEKYISEYDYEVGYKVKIKPDDILMTRIGSVGDCYVIDRDEPLAYYVSLALLKPKVKDVNSHYLKYYLESSTGKKELDKRTLNYAVPKKINKDAIGYVLISLPKLEEQQAIATTLSDMDELISNLDELIEKKKNIKKGAMQKLLTGKKRLPGFTGERKEKRLCELGNLTGAGVDKKVNIDEIPVRLVNFVDVFHKDFLYNSQLNFWVTATPEKVAQCNVKQGDVFFTPSSEMPYDIALSAVAMEDMENVCYSYHVYRFRFTEDIDLKFRTYMFKTKKFYEQANTICEGSGKRYVIGLTKFKELKVIIPPTTEEQQEIATILSDMDKEIEALEEKKAKYEQIKQGAMQKLLTGKIRLV